ncbi:Amidohydrolase [Chryseolinea serpens]|uniref:Amidohydrolase n=1 Tax=Chryseolinea serpens TaxID=947013 RepID=A0A1M5M6S7_9BACT|nr:amidohydrolase family protein [Chryseolinea serpens]SHG72976.1 Amidohydrolase [Chryseolinea serpens]
MAPDPQPPLTNCHTHIFTGRHVPPYLGKTYLPLGLAYVLTIPFIVGIFRFWFIDRFKWIPVPVYNALVRRCQLIKIFIARNRIVHTLVLIVGTFISVNVFLILFQWLGFLFPVDPSGETSFIDKVRLWMGSHHILLADKSTGVQILLILIVVIFFQTGRNLIFFVLKHFFKIFGLLPGKQTFAYLSRYLNIGRFAFYKDQSDIFSKLVHQYPMDTRFVILPMDMEFIDAGKPKEPYRQQMEALGKIKANHPSTVLPFIFIDPRRIEKQPDFFVYSLDNKGDVVLEDCDVKRYLDQGFCGFKIYPALGYYPFEEQLLPVWKYAVQKDLPIMTHCIRGTIFYRGAKKRAWDFHPFFEDGRGEPLLLPQKKNVDFTPNFTHPLNYLVLLKEFLLRRAVSRATDKRIKMMFGFTNEASPLQKDLEALKLCFGHFGGDDEWEKYFEADRDQYSPAILHQPFGIDFLKNADGIFSHAKIADIWQHTDWYSIVCSIMLQHPRVYSDISYILHQAFVFPLLNDTLNRLPIPPCTTKLADRVLYGTDFYVVRNHNSEKQLFAQLRNNLSVDEVDQITRINPALYV